MKNAFMFPGQGSQYVGMAKDLYSNSTVKSIIDRASDITGTDIAQIMFYGPIEKLTESKNTQIAIFLHSISVYSLIKNDIQPSIVCGHSLGEYSALFAAGIISLEDGITLVRKRGELMSLAGEKAEGAMAAVIGMDAAEIEKHIMDIDGAVIANYNGPMQTVISGSRADIEKAVDTLNNAGAKRVIKLNVSGAFHSPLMDYAYDEFSCFIDNFNFNKPSVPIIMNVTGKIESNENNIKKYLKKQIISPVRWTDTMNLLIDEGIDKFYELGPQKALAGMIKRMTKNPVVSLGTGDDIKSEVSSD